jgi:hypothetical protein
MSRGSLDNIFEWTGADTNAVLFDDGAENDIKKFLGSSGNLLVPNNAQSGDLYAFHDGDLQPPGWGDCDFPIWPLPHTRSGVLCVRYTVIGPICPPQPHDIFYPRTDEEKAMNQTVYCDQVKDSGHRMRTS